MEEFITRYIENLLGRASGPMHIRLFVQPTMSLIFAARAGFRDAKTRQAPYLWALFRAPEGRRDLMHQCWKDVGKIFILALVLDVVYQLVTTRWVYPGETLTLAIVLAFIPYLVFRGLFTRLAHVVRSDDVRHRKNRNYA